MKKNLTYAGAALLLLLGVACNKEENFVLENTYHLDKLLVAEGAGFNDELYTFTVELAEEGVTGAAGSYSGTGKVVRYQFYGSKYYLDSSVYPAVAAGGEKDASYVATQSTVYDVANGTVTSKGISDGYVYVSKSGSDYRFGTTSKLSDGAEFKFVSGVKIDFPKLPKYKYINNPIQAYQAADRYVVEFANGTVAMESGTMTGEGLLFHLEFPMGFSMADGTYGEGAYMPGFLNDIYAAWGAVWDEGSRVIEYAGGSNKVSFYLTNQTITISTTAGGLRHIEVDCDDVIYIFEGSF